MKGGFTFMQFNEIFNDSNHEMVALSICCAADPDILYPVLKLVTEKNITIHLVDNIALLKKEISDIDTSFLSNDKVILHHSENDKEAAQIAVSLTADGTCNILMKGMLSTSVILKEVLKKNHQLLTGTMLSHVALFDIPNYHKSILLSDSAMNITPDIKSLKSIIKNSVDTAHQLNILHPNVALLSAVEKVNKKIQSTVTAEALTEYYRNSENFTVDGPLQYDLALSLKAAEQKNIESVVAGDADILIVPEINAGNLLYKSLVYSAGARVAANIVGAKVPIVLTSRSDSSEDKYNSICLAIYTINSKI